MERAIRLAAHALTPGFPVEDFGSILAASRIRVERKGHRGGFEPPTEAVEKGLGGGDDDGDSDTDRQSYEREHDLACDLIRLVRALVWGAIASQLATLTLVGALSGADLAIRLGWFNVSTDTSTSSSSAAPSTGD